MANHHAPDGIADDFFEQIFSYGGAEGAAAAGGHSGGEDGNFAGIVLQLNSGEGQVGSTAGDHMVGSGGFLPAGTAAGGGVFPLGLSLDQGGGGGGGGVYGKVEDGSSSVGKRFRDDHILIEAGGKNPSLPKSEVSSLFPAFVQTHQIRPNNPAPQVQAFHAQAAQQPPAPRPRVRARRGQATDPHSIAERLRRERIAERIKALQDLVPNTNKTDRAAMLDEIVGYVKFLRLQVKVLSMSRIGGAGAVAQLVADVPLSSVEGSGNDGGNNQQIWEKWSTDGTEQQVAKLMEEDVGAAMQFLQSKALCIMPISLAATIYNTPHQMEARALIKPESNVP